MGLLFEQNVTLLVWKSPRAQFFHGVHSYYTILRIFAESIMALDVVWMKLLGLAFDI
jgi:hypothetical protein